MEKKSHKSYDPISNRGYTEMEAYGDLVLIGSSVAIWKQLSNTSDDPKYEDINEDVDKAVFEDVGIFLALLKPWKYVARNNRNVITYMLCNKSVILSDIVIDNIFDFYMKILLSDYYIPMS